MEVKIVQQLELEMHFQTIYVLTYILEGSLSKFRLCLKRLLGAFGWKEVGLDWVDLIAKMFKIQNCRD